MGLALKRYYIKEVIRLNNNGFSNKQIGNKIGISEKTIGFWLKDIKAKRLENSNLIKTLENKIIELSKMRGTGAEINQLTKSIKTLETRWFQKTN